MNSTDNPAYHTPPNTASHSAPPPEDGDAGGAPDFGPGAFFAPALRGDSEQFPVLKAFQAYVEEERERARRRVVVVSASAIAAITILVALFLVALGFLMRRNDQLNDRLLDIVTTRPATPAVSVAAPATPAPHTQTPEEAAREAELQTKLAALEQANAAMVKRMEELQSLPDMLAASVGGLISNAVEQALPPSAPPPHASTPAPMPEAPTPAVSVADASATSPLPQKAASDAMPPPPPAAPPVVDSIRVKPIAAANPGIPGYGTEQILLQTDKGVVIPWRIAVPE